MGGLEWVVGIGGRNAAAALLSTQDCVEILFASSASSAAAAAAAAAAAVPRVVLLMVWKGHGAGEIQPELQTVCSTIVLSASFTPPQQMSSTQKKCPVLYGHSCLRLTKHFFKRGTTSTDIMHTPLPKATQKVSPNCRIVLRLPSCG